MPSHVIEIHTFLQISSPSLCLSSLRQLQPICFHLSSPLYTFDYWTHGPYPLKVRAIPGHCSSNTCPGYAAGVLAGSVCIRSSFGAAFLLFARGMYKNFGVAWASLILGCLSIAFILVPFVLYRVGLSSYLWSLMQEVLGLWLTLEYQFGETIRRRSKLARQDF